MKEETEIFIFKCVLVAGWFAFALFCFQLLYFINKHEDENEEMRRELSELREKVEKKKEDGEEE